MPNFTITANTDYPMGADTPAIARGNGDMAALRYFINQLQGVASNGTGSQSVYLSWNDAVAVGNDAFAGVGAGLLVLSGGAGAVGGTIAGTLVTATFATSDVNTSGLVAAAIRANTTVNQYVTANNLLMQVTLASVVAGTTLTVCGITFTAVANSAAIRQFGQYNIDGADAADATALALAINRHPALTARCRAVSNGAAVLIGLLDSRTAVGVERVQNPNAAATITVNAGIPTASASCMVLSLQPGVMANEVRCVPSGTGMTFVTANATANLLGGATGGGRVTQRLVGQP
jgi:hypothetical protein